MRGGAGRLPGHRSRQRTRPMTTLTTPELREIWGTIVAFAIARLSSAHGVSASGWPSPAWARVLTRVGRGGGPVQRAAPADEVPQSRVNRAHRESGGHRKGTPLRALRAASEAEGPATLAGQAADALARKAPQPP